MNLRARHHPCDKTYPTKSYIANPPAVLAALASFLLYALILPAMPCCKTTHHAKAQRRSFFCNTHASGCLKPRNSPLLPRKGPFWPQPSPALMTSCAALKETMVQFPNQRGEKLAGTLVDPPPYEPTDGSEIHAANDCSTSTATPVVIMAHGYMSSRNSELLVRLSTALARNAQLSSFRFDFSGNGDSEGRFRYGQYR